MTTHDPPRRPDSPLGDTLVPGIYGACAGGCRVVLTECVVPTVWAVLGAPAPGGILDLPSPAVARTMHETRAGAASVRVVPFAPREWRVLADRELACAERPLAPVFTEPLRVFDLTHGCALVRLAGEARRGVLEKGCPLDLRRLGPGAAAATVLGPYTVVLMCDAGGVELLLARSLARSAAAWLLRAALEFGCEVRARRPWTSALGTPV